MAFFHSPRAEMPAVRRVLAEPLVHFLVIAGVIVAAERIYAGRHDRFRVVMTEQRVTQLAESYRLQFGIEAGPDLREALVEKDFEDEVLFRQALALGLDQDDEIIRRRLIQKMLFVSQDRQAPAEPTPAQLEKYFAAHRDGYRTSPAATFTHVFFSSDVDGSSAARARAVASLERLSRAGALRAPAAGDVFPDRYDFAHYGPQQVTRLFGQTEFSEAVFTSPIGRWAGPFRSAYGWHLLRIAAKRPAIDPPLDDIRDRVRADYLRAAQDATNAAALAALKKQFRLVREDGREGQ